MESIRPLPSLTLEQLDAGLGDRLKALRAKRDEVRESRQLVEASLENGGAHYGVNTGFGALARQRIDRADVEQLQVNLLRSHAVGVGPPVPKGITRRMLQLKIHTLGLGYSGVSEEAFERLLVMAERDLIPVVPTRGSLGASGDLAPLAHLALPLLGEGELWSDGTPMPAAEVLARHDLQPITLHAKDGLALINGTQFMAAYGCEIVRRAKTLATTADVVAAMTLEACRGSLRPFDVRVHAVRAHPGHGAVAANVRSLLDGSDILASHAHCGKVQDPYSVRCVPQVHGASRDALTHMAQVVETEVNSVTDNPLVFADDEGQPDLISAGNFHGQPLALAFDYAAIALAEWASISERRTYLLLDGYDGLPPFLIAESGLQSGLMIPQYTAAALVSENKTLAHPASVDSIPSSKGQEDHVSMGAWGALKGLQVLENAERVLAIELLCAAQALDFRRPLKAGRGVEAAHAAVRTRVLFRESDRSFTADLTAVTDLVRSGSLVEAVEAAIGRLL
ncbi:MAG: histidine ammonia-lyase [Rhodothermaceae bacterium]|nr:histidine ammonia-lyase [Rhodothermaceae bacterium]